MEVFYTMHLYSSLRMQPPSAVVQYTLVPSSLSGVYTSGKEGGEVPHSTAVILNCPHSHLLKLPSLFDGLCTALMELSAWKSEE